MLDIRVVIIGGGGTGAAIAHDLCLRGFTNVTLLERGELTSGTTGRHHGLLHSGARYALTDAAVARECITECGILQRITTGVIERNYGLFVARSEEELAYEKKLMEACKQAGIPFQHLDSSDKILSVEPNLSPEIRSALVVPDGTFDAWRLPLQFFASAKHNGAKLHPFTTVTNFEVTDGRVCGVEVYDYIKKESRRIESDVVINATGAWAGKVAALCDIDLPVSAGAGCMVAVRGRLVNMVINRSYYPGDGDIIVPQRQLSIIGTTNTRVDDPDWVETSKEAVEGLLKSAEGFIPSLRKMGVHARWAACRPLVGKSADVRSMSRDFVCLDHEVKDNKAGILSVIGGKATTLRIMAEKTVNLLCKKLGVERPCQTAEYVLRPYRDYYLEVT